MIKEIFDNIEQLYTQQNKRKTEINKEYKLWIRTWKNVYTQLVIGLIVFVDKAKEWEEKDKEMYDIYNKLIKKTRKHMKKLEVE